MLNNDTSFYHYVRVDVHADGEINHSMVRLEARQHPVLSTLESLWFFIYSLFYVGYVNFILLVAVFVLISTKLYTAIFVAKDYYPDYDLDPQPWLSNPLRWPCSPTTTCRSLAACPFPSHACAKAWRPWAISPRS